MYYYNNIKQLQFDLLSNKTTCVSIVEELIKAIDDKKQLNAYLEVFTESAKAQAIEIDKKIAASRAHLAGTSSASVSTLESDTTKLGKLAGVVIAIKDNICYKGHKVSCSSKILEGFESLYSSTVVERLLSEDAIIIGRLNCDEFAMGGSNENSAYGKVLNPLNEKMVPGGSSGGSAAAMAADLCHIALGSDTGGSIRQPAAFTGTVGLKPTYGRVSRWGLVAYGSSFDQIGPITKNVDDAALLLEVMAGADEFDTTASTNPVTNYSEETHVKKTYKIAYLKECVEAKGLDEEVKQHTLAALDKLKTDGHTVNAVDFPYLDFLVPTYYVLTTAEASSNLSRFDGVYFGYRSPNATDLESTYKKSRSEGFGKEVKRRIMLGTFVLSAGYYDAYYSKAQKVRNKIREKTREILKDYDFIVTPSTPSTAFEFGKNSKDPIQMYLEDIFTVQANLVGAPAISIPNGTHSNGLPIGIQLMGRDFAEGDLLNMAKQIYNS